MATLAKDPNGTHRILFVCPATRARKTIRLGKLPAKSAATIQNHIEALVSSKASGQPLSLETAAWLGRLEGTLRTRIESTGLVEPAAASKDRTLGELIAEYKASLDIKPQTHVSYNQCWHELKAFFGADQPLAGIGILEVDRFRTYLKGRNFSVATIAKIIKISRRAFNKAFKWDFIHKNPFSDVVAGSFINDERSYHVPREDIEQVMDAATDDEWRLTIALSRFGGLRCPSETLLLTWSDIHWDRMRMTVHSPKTSRHQGKAQRIVPIFPELYPYLRTAFEQAEPGAVYVITRYRELNANLRTRLLKNIKRAGLKPWPRLWHNMRASRQTELAAQFPLKAVCDWIGNSPEIARKHYLSTPESVFQEAITTPTNKAAQNAAQLSAVTARKGSFANLDNLPQPTDLQAVTKTYHPLDICKAFPTGIEPVTFSSGG